MMMTKSTMCVNWIATSTSINPHSARVTFAGAAGRVCELSSDNDINVPPWHGDEEDTLPKGASYRPVGFLFAVPITVIRKTNRTGHYEHTQERRNFAARFALN